MQGIAAATIFIFAILVWRRVAVNSGRLPFWQLAGEQPDVAVRWMKSRPDWIVISPDSPQVAELKKRSDLVGPFKLAVPSLGGIVTIFAELKSLRSSQDEFMAAFGQHTKRAAFPWISTALLILPIWAIFATSGRGASFVPAVGYGLANLGYLLFVVGIATGRFGILGLQNRKATIIMAAAVWLAGVFLSNLDLVYMLLPSTRTAFAAGNFTAIFSYVLTMRLQGTWTRTINSLIAGVCIAMLILWFVIFGWKTGLIAFILTFTAFPLADWLAAPIAAHLLVRVNVPTRF